MKDERVQDCILRVLDFVFRYGMLSDVVYIFVKRLNGFNCALTLCAHYELQESGMAEIGADASAHVVSQAALGADIIEQARGKSAAERIVIDGTASSPR
jgi:hypothetical protein